MLWVVSAAFTISVTPFLVFTAYVFTLRRSRNRRSPSARSCSVERESSTVSETIDPELPPSSRRAVAPIVQAQGLTVDPNDRYRIVVEVSGITLLIGTVIIFVVSMLAGGFGNYVSIRALSDNEVTFGHAVISSVISAAVWAGLSYLLNVYVETSVLVFGGALVSLLVWIVVLYFRYSGGIATAIPAAVFAWIIAVVVLYVVAVVSGLPFQAIGIPAV